MIKKIIIEFWIIIFLSVTLSVTINMVRPEGISFFPAPEEALVAGGEAAQSISVEDASVKYESSAYLFLDARPEYDYENGHIKGAINLPDMEFEDRIGDFFVETPLETPIITYCDGIDCHLAKSLAEKLISAGYSNVMHMEEGYSAWLGKSFPVEKGA